MDIETEIEELKQDLNFYKVRINELSEYNAKWPHDLNKYLKMMRNDIEDLRDYVDRLDHKKSKYDLFKKLKTIDDIYIKQLALENELINVKMSLHQLETKKSKNKKLKSDINNTKYSIKKLLMKQNAGTLTEKENERLKDKQKLLEELLEQQ
jgi:hypothetical protein